MLAYFFNIRTFKKQYASYKDNCNQCQHSQRDDYTEVFFVRLVGPCSE